MEVQEREAAIDAEQNDELDLCLGLRLAPSRRNPRVSNSKLPAEKSTTNLSLIIPIRGQGCIRSEQQSDEVERKRKSKSNASIENPKEKRRALERGIDVFHPVVGGLSQVGEKQLSCSRESSTGVSDYQSTSGQGGSSSDGGSYSDHSHTLNQTNSKDCTPTSNGKQIRTFHHDSEPSTPHNSSKGKPDCSFSTDQTELNRNSNVQPKIQSPSKAVAWGRPPKPEAQPSNEAMTQMPCVATTGNGPNGKRITGFLYKYTKLEVSIVCVCHGTSFSPAGFVEHAGGVGIENPLRHITIASSVFK